MRFEAAKRRRLPELGSGNWAKAALFAAVSIGLLTGSLFRHAAISGGNARTSVQVRITTEIESYNGRILQKIRPYAGDPEGCQQPKLDEDGLRNYGCKVLKQVCFDQNKMIVFSAKPNEAFDFPFFSFGWTPSFIPGYDLAQAMDHAPNQLQPLVRKNSSADRPDLRDPIFSRCNTPLVWPSPWILQFAEFELNSFVPLWYMQHELKLFDRNIMLVPMLDGFEAPRHVDFFLRPYTDGIIAPFHEVSSRQHMFDPSFPRCFETVAVCGLKGLYQDRPPPKFKKPWEKDPKALVYFGDPDWRVYHPSKAGRALVDYYTAKGALHAPSPEPEVLKVVVANRTGPFRRFLELDKFIEACNAWKPPQVQGGVKRLRCEGWTFGGGLVGDAQKLQEIDVLITHHGAELNHGFFMPWGSSVVEVRPKDFDDYHNWGDVYLHSISRQETLIFYWQAKVTKDENWRMSDLEAAGNFKYQESRKELNRHSIPRWPLYQPILEAIVRTNRSREAYLARPYETLVWEV